MENSTAQLETRWILHLGSAGGRALFIHCISPCLIVFCHRSDRICPGQHLAHSTLTLAAASVLSTFDLLRKVDENGQETEPKREYTKSLTLRLVLFSVLAFLVLSIFYSQQFDFLCVIKPRYCYTVELIRSSCGLELVE